jgi:serine/threonine protein kinase
MRLQRQFNGQLITIDTNNIIASGGEGRIYAVLQDPSLVAKIYHKPTDEDGDKLAVMYSMPPDAPMAAPGHASIAWPLDLLRTVGGREKIIGFLMPRVVKVSPIHIYYTPKTRREEKPLFNYLYLHRTARNLAAAINALHLRGYVIGDVNESNILVTDTALITLVDTDSFQVRDPYTGYVHRCPVGKPEFTPPELQSQAFRDIDRKPENDLFGLGVLIFQLLMEGTHPFSGVYEGSDEPPPIETRIQRGYFPYGTKKVPIKPMPVAPSFDILHPKLREMFIQCFEEGYQKPSARPDAKTWVNVLKEAEEALVSCDKNNQHKYGSHLKSCPWCDRAKRLKGRDPFPSRLAVENGQHLQQLQPKKKRNLTPVPIIPQPQVKSAPRSSGMRQKMGQYQAPLIPFPYSRSSISVPMPLSPQESLARDLVGGILWGILCLSALLGVLFALTYKNGGAIQGAIFVGTLWGAFFGLVGSLLASPSTSFGGKALLLLLGCLEGAVILAALGGIVFGALNGDILAGKAIASGAIIGLIWGTIWHLFKPPLAIPFGRVWGISGALLGATWGTFLGNILGIMIGGVFVILQPIDDNMIMTKLIHFLIQTLLITSGLGSLFGMMGGSLLGAVGLAPKLPISFQPTGRKGAALGSIWGSFIGAMTGGIVGLAGAGILTYFNHLNSNLPWEFAPLIGVGIVATGIGAIWGSISGSIWGALGKWY